MKKHVKITTLGRILDLFYPCYCKGCGKIGYVFCDCCIFYNRRYNPPFLCDFDSDFHLIFVCGLREGILSQLVRDYKYHARRHYTSVFGKILDWTVKELLISDEKFVIVPLPTALKHVRQRGFDHIMTIAEEFSRKSGFSILPILERASDTVQVGSSKLDRKIKAREAYVFNSKILRGGVDEEWHFLLLDDVWTTGASMRAAFRILRDGLIKIGVNPKKIKISAIVLLKNDGYEFG